MFLDNFYWIVCLLVCLIWGSCTFFVLHARLRARTLVPGAPRAWLILYWIKIWNAFFLNSRFTIEVGLNYTQMKDSPVQKYLKKLSQQMEKCKFDLFPEQRSLPGDFQLFSQPIVLNWKLEKVCIIITRDRLRRAWLVRCRKLCFYTFAGPWVISVSWPLGKWD